jgi:hypothetical protein
VNTTVGRALSDEIGAEIVRCAGLVLDHHRLPHRGGELVADEARNHVDGAAGRRRHHDLDRARGVRLRLRVQRAH